MVARSVVARTAMLIAALAVGAPVIAAQSGDAGAAAATAVRASAPEATAVRADGPVRVDGRLDEQAWRSARVLDGFVQSEPIEGNPASERTEVRVLFDANALYVGAWLFDRDPAAIVVGETRRDASLTDADAVSIILDTYLDRQNGFVFATTPAGIEYDGQVTREGQGGAGAQVRQQRGAGGGFNLNWDGRWEVATSRDGEGWYAEFRIPFSTLRYGRGGSQRWGLNVSRTIRRRNEEAFWAPVPRQFDLHRVSLAGLLAGVDAPAQRLLTVTPYTLGSTRKDYVAGSPASTKGEFGGDAKIGLSQSLTLDLTVNTDFAQVEVDDEQINLTRFPLFFPEKRPFFLENAGTFAVGTPQSVEMFFSRRIGIQSGAEVPILGGGRVTGKLGNYTIGLLNMQADELPALTNPGVTAPIAPPTNFAVGRIIRDFRNRTRLGAMIVNRANTDGASDYNRTYAADGRLGIGAPLTFDAYAARSERPGVGAGAYAYGVAAAYTSRNWNITSSTREVGAAFNPGAGFLSRSSYRYLAGRIQRNVRFSGVTWLREWRPHLQYSEFFGLDGLSETRLIHVDSHFEFPNGAFFQLPGFNLTREGIREPFTIAKGVVVPPGTYDNPEWGFAYNTNLSAPVSLQGRIDIGGFYSGRRAGTGSTLNIRSGDTFTNSLRVDYYDVSLKEGSFTTLLWRLRTAYSFSPRLYVQTLLQYNRQSETFSSNIRFGWLNTAGTGLFVVLNNLENIGTFDRTQLPEGPLERALLVKFTRLINFGG
ncbi:MAG: DUF5916 domain-containing protein [Gemmatimonadetes bacterium]|nr:DUF5916 domain-containing protein [Gemmatimonadota bacterium]